MKETFFVDLLGNVTCLKENWQVYVRRERTKAFGGSSECKRQLEFVLADNSLWCPPCPLWSPPCVRECCCDRNVMNTLLLYQIGHVNFDSNTWSSFPLRNKAAATSRHLFLSSVLDYIIASLTVMWDISSVGSFKTSDSWGEKCT